MHKKILHFDRERTPERVVHALGSGAYGKFESYGDWSNITMACWLQEDAVSEAFSRFSVVVASVGGSDNERDTHGFATKIYSVCGNQDLVGNHLSSFFINDGAEFPDLIHAVKMEADKGFPTDGTAHPTAYDFFNLHPEGAMQLMQVLSDLGTLILRTRKDSSADLRPRYTARCSPHRRLRRTHLPVLQRARPVNVVQVVLATQAGSSVSNLR